MNYKNLNYEIETVYVITSFVHRYLAMNYKNLNYEIETDIIADSLSLINTYEL